MNCCSFRLRWFAGALLMLYALLGACGIAAADPPSTPVIQDDGRFTHDRTQLHSTWSATDDGGISEYLYRIFYIDSSDVEHDVVAWTQAATPAATEVTATGLSLIESQTYYFAVKAKDTEDNWSEIGVSDGISVPLSPHSGVVALTAEVQSSPASITLSWQQVSSTDKYWIFRRLKDTADWGDAVAAAISGTSYTDMNVQLGQVYDYKVVRNYNQSSSSRTGYISAGIDAPKVEARGRVLLVVDETYASSLEMELARLQQDLVADGWKVVRHDVNRHTATWPDNKSGIDTVKQLITDYNTDTDSSNDIDAVYLFGRVPVPYSGNYAHDGHGDHAGAWPADVYYADMDSDLWTDETVDTRNNYYALSRTENVNIPYDGKFDQGSVPQDGDSVPVELIVGRVDLANMPAFANSQYTTNPKDELELLRQYLNKSHNYRYRNTDVQPRGFIDANFSDSANYNVGGWNSLTACFGRDGVDSDTPVPGTRWSQMHKNRWFETTEADSYLMGYADGPGWYAGCDWMGSTYPVTSDHFTLDDNQTTADSKVVFNILFGSYFGDWDSTNNFLRAPLCTSTYGLTSFWGNWGLGHTHPMAMGESVGYAMRSSQNIWGHKVLSLMGDPTLRLHMIAPVSGVTVSRTTGTGPVDLGWTASADSVKTNFLGYNVYRAANPYAQLGDMDFECLNSSPVTGTSYTDNAAPAGNNVYMVRAVARETSASGTYINLSQGVFPDKVATPTFDPPAGTYNPGQSISFSCSTSGATIRFTTDGSDPDESDPSTTSIALYMSTVVKLRAWKAGMAVSDVASAEYKMQGIPGTVSAPTINPGSGQYYEDLNVEIDCPNPGSTVYYSTDNVNWTLYQAPVPVSSSTTLYARAEKIDWTNSPVSSATYTFKVATPKFSIGSGSYTSAQSVEITCATPNAQITYSTDGVNWNNYSGPIVLDATTTLVAKAVRSGWLDSDQASETYTFTNKVDTPVFSSAGGFYTGGSNVTITCATSGATIYYATDYQGWTQYDPALGVDLYRTTTLYAKAVKEGMPSSDVATADFRFVVYVDQDAPGLTPDGGSWNSAYKTLADALTQDRVKSGDEVWVASGTYQGGITIPSGVALYGGFAGSESDRGLRDWVANPTTVDGSQVSHVVTIADYADSDTRIDGFTICNNSPGSGTSGVMCGQYSSPAILNNTIKNLQAGVSSGVYCNQYSTPTISGNIITGINSWGSGGGVNLQLNSAPTIVNNTIVGNTFPSGGGGISGTPLQGLIANNIIASNTYGIYAGPNSVVNIQNNCVYANTSGNYYGIPDLTGHSNNISEDPLFFDPSQGNYHILLESPCVDAGNSLAAGLPDYDIDLQSRIMGIQIDIGADECYKVAAPVFSPAGGTFDGAQTVTITCAEPGAVIHYTTNGVEPTTTDPVVTGPMTVNQSVTLKAKAFLDSWTYSPTASATYHIVTVIHVNGATGSDSNNGYSWSAPKQTIAAGLASASAGNEVWVAEGLYEENLTLVNGVGLYGGFFGWEPQREIRDFNEYETVIDGVSSYVVNVPSGVGEDTVIDGFTITGGTGYYVAGGILCSGSATISHNIIKDNQALYTGAGIGCLNGSSPKIINNIIVGNSCYDGAAIHCSSGSPIITNNTIVGNNSSTLGSIYLGQSGAVLSNNIVAFNSKGIQAVSGNTAVLQHNNVYANTGFDYLNIAQGTGDISDDPLLADWQNGDYHIPSASPCVDAGTSAAQAIPASDMDNQTRIWNTIDIGADECIVYHVSDTGSDSAAGNSWSSAKATLQGAVDAVTVNCGAVDFCYTPIEVWVAAHSSGGYYSGCEIYADQVKLYGGFAGTETQLDQRNWTANETTISSNGASSTVIKIYGMDCVVDGFTIMGANNGMYPSLSGAVDIFGNGLVAHNRIVSNNACGVRAVGNYTDQAPVIVNNVIDHNMIGVLFNGYAPDNVLAHNTLTYNSTAIWGENHSHPLIHNNIIAFNNLGMDFDSTSSPNAIMTNCLYGNLDDYCDRVDNMTWLLGNDIFANPLFVSSDDYHITSGSPCIDTADGQYAPVDDYDGTLRPVDGDSSGTAAYDIGADEYVP